MVTTRATTSGPNHNRHTPSTSAPRVVRQCVTAALIMKYAALSTSHTATRTTASAASVSIIAASARPSLWSSHTTATSPPRSITVPSDEVFIGAHPPQGRTPAGACRYTVRTWFRRAAAVRTAGTAYTVAVPPLG